MAIKTHQKKFLDSLAASATFSNGHNLSVELKSKIKSKRSFFGCCGWFFGLQFGSIQIFFSEGLESKKDQHHCSGKR